MARKDNYQSFYPTKNPSLLDAKVGQPNGWVSKDGMWKQQYHQTEESLPSFIMVS